MHLLNANLLGCLAMLQSVWAFPTTKRQAVGQTPLISSSEVWASVVANVTPLMALVGERHAKEYLRTMSGKRQLLNLAVAPLGILSILVSAVRLCGFPYLRRLIGREGEKRNEAMVELTPVSMSQATPVYVDGRIEIEPNVVKDAAFICCHRRLREDAPSALRAFRSLWLRRKEHHGDQDHEIVLSLRRLDDLSLKETATLIENLEDAGKDGFSNQHVAMDATISFRTTGVSPAATLASSRTSMSRLMDMLVATGLTAAIIGIQIAGYASNNTNGTDIQGLIMGLVGYSGVVTSTVALLLLIQSEVVLQTEPLPALFRDGQWTVSNATHSKWRCIEPLKVDGIVSALPARHAPQDSRARDVKVAVCGLGLVGCYVIYYLGIRVAPWWVALNNMVVLWLAAAYRAFTTQSTYQESETQTAESWTAIPGNTVSDTVDQTLCSSEIRPSGDCLLMFSSPIRISPMSWSSAQDVLKVSIELTHQKSLSCGWNSPSEVVNSKTWGFIVRFNLVVYIPGYIFRCEDSTDLAVELHFTFDHLTWTVLKLLHTCLDQSGSLSTYTSPTDRREKVLATFDGEDVAVSYPAEPKTLRAFLKPFSSRSLDQALLLPAIQVCSIYERFYYTSSKSTGMQTLQARHVDQLGLSASPAQLKGLQEELEEQGVWNSFMAPLSELGPKPKRIVMKAPEDHYSQSNRLWADLTGAIDGEERAEGATAGAVEGSGS